MANYKTFQELARDLLGKYSTGQFTYNEPGQSVSTPFDLPANGSSYVINGALSTSKTTQRESSQVSGSSMDIKFPHIDPKTNAPIDFKPDINGTMTIDGFDREITKVISKMGAGDVIMWVVTVKV